MLYIQTDTGHSFFFEFKFEEELIVPDTGSVTITLSKLDNVAITGYDAKAITPPVGESYAVLLIDSTVNDKTTDFEMRQLRVNFTYNSQPFEEYINYQIVDRVNIPVTTSEVRQVLGVDDSDIPDEYFDLINSFHNVDADLESLDLETEIQSGSSTVRDLLQSIKYKAALDVIPALQLAVNQSEQADNVVYKRFVDVDFEKLKIDINTKYSDSITKAIEGTSTSLTYMVATQDTDAVTGE